MGKARRYGERCKCAQGAPSMGRCESISTHIERRWWVASSFFSRARQFACVPGTVYVLAMGDVCVSERRCKYERGVVFVDMVDGTSVRAE